MTSIRATSQPPPVLPSKPIQTPEWVRRTLEKGAVAKDYTGAVRGHAGVWL